MQLLKKLPLAIVGSLLSAHLSFSNILNDEKVYLEGEQKTLSEASKKTTEELTAIAIALRALTIPQKTMTTMLSSDSEIEKKKRQRRILESSLSKALKRQILLQQKETETKAQLQLLDLASKHSKAPQPSSSKKSHLLCASWPIKPSKPSHMIRDFGTTTDVETNLSWQHSGWLLDSSQSEVVSCSKGRVVFSGVISGRDHVIIIEHEGNHLATYAHLDPSRLAPKLKRGAFVNAGDSLGMSLNKFYFEIRHSGVTIDPRQVFSKKLITSRLSDLTK